MPDYVVHAGPGCGKTTLFKKMPGVFFDPEDCPQAVHERHTPSHPFFKVWDRKPWRKNYDGWEADLEALNDRYVVWANSRPRGSIVIANVANSPSFLKKAGLKLAVTCFRTPANTLEVMTARAKSGHDLEGAGLPSKEIIASWYDDWTRSVDRRLREAPPEIDPLVGLMVLQIGSKHYLSDYADAIVQHIRWK